MEAASFDHELQLFAAQALARALDARAGEIGDHDFVASHGEGEGDGGGNDGGGEEPRGERGDLRERGSGWLAHEGRAGSELFRLQPLLARPKAEISGFDRPSRRLSPASRSELTPVFYRGCPSGMNAKAQGRRRRNTTAVSAELRLRHRRTRIAAK